MSSNPSTSTTSVAENDLPDKCQQAGHMPHPVDRAFDEGIQLVRQCVREHPEAAALFCLGIGFVLGWKLKPW